MLFFRTLLVSIITVVSLSGCSLLEVKLESATTPLTQQQFNSRMMTREYAQGFFAQVESTAELLHSQYASDDQIHQSYIYLWKINAAEGMRTSAYQVMPMASLVDSWVFTAQMEQFFTKGAGKTLFLNEDAKQTSINLAKEFDQMAGSLLGPEAYKASQKFVAEFAAEHPFADLSFILTPAYRDWLKSNDITAEQAKSSLGTMPEAMGDMADRLSVVSDVTPKIMTWKTQLIALNGIDTMDKVNDTLDGIKSTSESINSFIANNPEYMRNLAAQMTSELEPLVDDINKQAGIHIAQLGHERAALEQMVARERQELAQIIHSERALFAKDIEKVSEQAINQTMDKLIELIKSTIIYFILFILAIFFAPLGLGYMLGKRAAVKKAV